jgi:fructose-1,6-bisphosphatase/inositol monophosphatase family enzyme
MQYTQELAFAKKMASEAGEIMRKFYRGNQKITIKKDRSPVTVADQTINELLIQNVQQEFPTHGVLGEEASWEPRRTHVWVCDPIDGTVAYILHLPTSMFSLAFVIDGQPVVAVAFNPWTNELYWAVKDGGAWRNEEKIYVSQKKWEAGVHLAGSSGGNKEPVDKKRKKLESKHFFVSNVHGTVFKGCLIAEGSVEARSFMHSGAHDVAAIKLIIEEAGGKVTDLDGNQQRYDRPVNGCVMSNGHVHDDFLALVQS